MWIDGRRGGSPALAGVSRPDDEAPAGSRPSPRRVRRALPAAQPGGVGTGLRPLGGRRPGAGRRPRRRSCGCGGSGRTGRRSRTPGPGCCGSPATWPRTTAKSAFRRNGTQPPELMNGVGSTAPPPLDKLERDEAFAQVRALLEELPAADREILTFRYALDYDATDHRGIARDQRHRRPHAAEPGQATTGRAARRRRSSEVPMTHGTPTPGQPTAPDDLDRLFSAFFRHAAAEAVAGVRADPRRPARRRTAVEAGRSRATLAASVAALLGFGLYLSSGPQQPPSGNEPPSGGRRVAQECQRERPRPVEAAERDPGGQPGDALP